MHQEECNNKLYAFYRELVETYGGAVATRSVIELLHRMLLRRK
jgi:hypothetical protein